MCHGHTYLGDESCSFATAFHSPHKMITSEIIMPWRHEHPAMPFVQKLAPGRFTRALRSHIYKMSQARHGKYCVNPDTVSRSEIQEVKHRTGNWRLRQRCNRISICINASKWKHHHNVWCPNCTHWMLFQQKIHLARYRHSTRISTCTDTPKRSYL